MARSWRESVSREAQDDLDGLLDMTLGFAEQTLARHGEMYPFGAAVTSGGEVRALAADPGLGEKPPSQAVLDLLYDAARASAGELRAVAFVSDVLVDGKDAVSVESEHREGVAIGVIVPYTRSRLRKRVTFGEMRAFEAERRVWG